MPPNSLRNAEVQADGLGVADVQIAVRLGRNARDDAVQPVGEIAANALTDEICEVFSHGGLLEPMLDMGIVRRERGSARVAYFAWWCCGGARTDTMCYAFAQPPAARD